MNEFVWDRVRSRLLENALHVGKDCADEVKERARLPSQRRVLVENVIDAALAHAREAGADADQYQYNIAGPGLAVVDHLQSGLTAFSWNDPDPTTKWNFWKHEEQPLRLIKSGKVPHISRETLEEVASDYLKLPYRADLLERTIIDVLIAMELYAYGDEMVRNPELIVRWLPTRSPLHQRHALLGYLHGTFCSAVVLLGLAYLGATFLPAAIGGWVAGILAGLFVLVLVVDTALLPWRWRHQHKKRRQVVDLIRLLNHTHGELSSGAVVSTRRLREVASKAADAGVVWPSPLFAMLDDNITRTGAAIASATCRWRDAALNSEARHVGGLLFALL